MLTLGGKQKSCIHQYVSAWFVYAPRFKIGVLVGYLCWQYKWRPM